MNKKAELADADHEPVERDRPRGRSWAAAKKNAIGTAAKKNLSAASMSGVVSPTPTLMAMKVRPQTIATLSAAEDVAWRACRDLGRAASSGAAREASDRGRYARSG